MITLPETEIPGAVTSRPRILDAALVLCVGLFVNGIMLGNGPLAGTEGHRALTAHQMVTSGHWLIPRLFDQYYLRKPPLHYWILASLESLTGQATPWMWRLPSAVAAALLALFLYWITARWYGRLAGLVAGISCSGLAALWGQGRTAEIDSLNTLACVITACMLIDISTAAAIGRNWIGFWAAVAFSAAMMLKGPAGIAVVFGAMAGPVVFDRNWKSLRSRWPWIVLAAGVGTLGIYAFAVWLEFRSLHVKPDTSGLIEVHTNIVDDRIKNLVATIALPVTMFTYMLPISLTLLPACSRRMWSCGGAAGWSESDRRLLRTLVGTIIASCAFSMLFGMANERYSYVWVPMICPVAGAVAAAWERGVFGQTRRDRISNLLVAGAVIFTVGCAGAAWQSARKFHVVSWVLPASVVAAVAICVLITVMIRRGKFSKAAWAFIALIVVTSLPFAMMNAADRSRRSTYTAALDLKRHVPEGTTVITGNLLMDQPELFYYSGLNVKSYPYDQLIEIKSKLSGWVVLNQKEFEEYQHDPKLVDAVNLNPSGPTVVLAWYGARPAATTEPAPLAR